MTAKTSPSLRRQLPAILVHPAVLAGIGIRPWTFVSITCGQQQRWAWLVASSEEPARHCEVSWASTAWLSYPLARDLEKNAGGSWPGISISIGLDHVRVQPARIERMLRSHQVDLAPDLLDKYVRDKRRFVQLVTNQRVMAAQVRRRAPLPAARQGCIRLNFSARLMLGIQSREASSIQPVQLSPFPHERSGKSGWAEYLRSPRRLSAVAVRVGESAGRAFLKAPTLALAVEEANFGDDDEGVVRVSEHVLEILGAEIGDGLEIAWGPKAITARVALYRPWALTPGFQPLVVDWTPTFRPPQTPENTRISVPAQIRARLGMPRNGVVVVRRSVLSRLRRRLTDLAVPAAALIVGAAALNLGWSVILFSSIVIALVVFLPERTAGSRRLHVHTFDPPGDGV